MRTIGDYRQLNDALFHAGTNSGSLAEYEDTPNSLHFYVISTSTRTRRRAPALRDRRAEPDRRRARRRVTSRSRTAPAQTTSRAASRPARSRSRTRAPTRPRARRLHPQDETACLHNDIYRLVDLRDRLGLDGAALQRAGHRAFGETVERPGLRHPRRRAAPPRRRCS